MAIFVGGDIKQLAFNNAEVGSGVFAVLSNQDNELDSGGLRNTDDVNSTTTTGDRIYQKAYASPNISVVCVSDPDRQHYEKAVALQKTTKETTFTVTLADGSVYKMKGQPSGEVKLNVNNLQFTLKVMGSGIMEKIS